MASKRRVRRKACESKRVYPDQVSAQKAWTWLQGRATLGERLHWYACGNHFHIGHVPGSERGKFARRGT